MINAPETKWTAHNIEGSFYTNPNRSTRNMTVCWRNKNSS